jgi:hypothetical protein
MVPIGSFGNNNALGSNWLTTPLEICRKSAALIKLFGIGGICSNDSIDSTSSRLVPDGKNEALLNNRSTATAFPDRVTSSVDDDEDRNEYQGQQIPLAMAAIQTTLVGT